MRSIVKITGIAGVIVVAACSGSSSEMSDELKKDLEQASAASQISLASAQTQGNQVVSAIERTTPPAPRRVAQSQRAPRYVPAPRRTPAPVEVAEADVSPEPEPQPVETAPAPVQPDILPSPRPQPVEVAVGGGASDGGGGGIDRGAVLGGVIQVVLRGGGVGDVDECDPRTDGRGGRRGGIAINNRFPILGGNLPGRVQGTFPGRVAGNIPGRLGGGIARQVSLPGRVRF